MDATTQQQATDQMTQAAAQAPVNQTSSPDASNPSTVNTPQPGDNTQTAQQTPQGQAQPQAQAQTKPAQGAPGNGDNQAAKPTGATQTPTQPTETGQPGLPPKPVNPAVNVANPNNPTNPANNPDAHPAVQRAGLLHNIALAMAGGQRYKENIDPNTGTMTRTPVPLSRADIGMAIAMEAISGALSGLSVKPGPGAVGRAAGAGYENQVEQQQQVQQQQDKEANDNYTRAAQNFSNNMRMLSLAQTVGQKDFDSNQKFAEQYKPLADRIQNDWPQSVLGIGGEEDAAKYHATKDTALPTGKVIPVLDPKTGQQAVGKEGNKLWQQEYMFINPNFSGDNLLTDEDRAEAIKYHLPSFVSSDGKPTNLPANLPMRISMALDYKHRLATLELGDQDLQNFYNKIGEKAPSLPDMVQKDPSITAAIDKFQPLLAATGGDYSKALGELGSGGQGRKADPQAAGRIMQLYGGTEAIQKYSQQQAKAKADAATQAAVDREKALAPVKEGEKRAGVATAVAQAGREEEARTQAAIDVKKRNGIPITGTSGSVKDMIKDPNVVSITSDPAEAHLTDGVNTTYLDKLRTANPNLAALVDQIGNGQQMLSAYGLAKNDGQVLGSMVARAYPDYQFQKAEAFKKAYTSYTAGADKDQIEHANNTYEHLARAFDAAADPSSYNPLSSSNTDYNVAVDRAMDEIHGAYSKGVQHVEEFNRAKENMKSVIPWKRQEGFRQAALLLSDKSAEKQNSYRRAKPTSKLPDFEIISPDAQAAFQHITGKQIGTNGFRADSLSGSPNNGAAQQPGGRPVMPQGTVSVGKGRDGQSYYLDANHKPIGIVPQ
jgi:hypothetical protein